MSRGTRQQSHSQSSKSEKSAQEIADATAANVSTAEQDNTAVGLPVASSQDSDKTASEKAEERAEERAEAAAEAAKNAPERVDHSGSNYTPAKPKGKILKPGQSIEFETDDADGLYVKVKQDIYREVQVRNAKRKTYVLLYAAGTMVPKTALQKIG